MPIVPVESTVDLDPIKAEVKQYVSLKDEISNLEDRVKTIKSRLTKAIEAYGKTNEKGHIVLDFNEGDDVTSIMKQRRVSKSFDETTADSILKSKGVYETCTKTITILDQDAVMAAYYDNILTDEDIDKMFPEKVSWALILGN
jgi:hypothetical protein